MPDPVAYLERISLTHFGPIDGHDDNLITAFFVRSTKTLVNGLSESLEFFRSIMDRDDVEDYQTVRDLAWIGLCGIDGRRPTTAETWSSLSGPHDHKRRNRRELVESQRRVHVNPFGLPAEQLSAGPDFGRIIQACALARVRMPIFVDREIREP